MRGSNQFGLLRLIQFSEEETTSIESYELIHVQMAIKLLLFDYSMHSKLMIWNPIFEQFMKQSKLVLALRNVIGTKIECYVMIFGLCSLKSISINK